MALALKTENLSKLYRLGDIGTGTMSHDLNRWWARIRGKEDPYLKIGQVNNRARIDSKHDQSPRAPSYAWALRDINFSVEQGEILGIIGRNGAGKSTLLKLLSRVTAPTTGTIKARGRIASLLEVGTGFHPELTGRENIYLNGAIMGMTRTEIKSRLEEIVDFSGCAKYIDTPVKRYSSGMTVRLGFSVAAHLDCEILVVDEVLAVGDAEFRKNCIGKMKDISRGTGKTVLFVSHNMASIQSLCTRAVLMDVGTIASQGSVAEIVKGYNDSNEDTQYLKTIRQDEFVISNQDGLNFEANCGDDIEIEFTVESERDVDALSAGFLLYSTDDHVVGGASSKFDLNYAAFSGRRWQVKFVFRDPRLIQGEYRLKIYLGNGQTDLLSFTDLLSLRVHEHDVFDIGREIPNSWGNSYFNVDWNFR